ncbi:MAG: glycosyltransferase family 2 protein [Thiobacillus sp.]
MALNSWIEKSQIDGGAIGPRKLEGGARITDANKIKKSGKLLVTIITSTCNASEHLPKAIQSIRNQTYGNVEWIVVDGASRDGTQDILRQNEDVIDYWVSEPDQGIYDAWNKGLSLARGEWICFLGADDFLWHPDVLEKLAPTLESAYPAHRVVYGSLATVNARGELLYCLGEPWTSVRHRFASVMALPHPGLMHHRSLFEAHGQFDTSFRIAGDYELLLRELRTGDALFVDDLVVAGMSTGGVSTTPAASWTMLVEMRRATYKGGRVFPGMAWTIAVFRHALRRLLWRLLGERTARRTLDWGRRVMGKPAHWTKT